MRSQTYGDKQREAQQRKKREELLEKLKPEGEPTTETPIDKEQQDQTPKKTQRKDVPKRRAK